LDGVCVGEGVADGVYVEVGGDVFEAVGVKDKAAIACWACDVRAIDVKVALAAVVGVDV